MKNTDTEVLQEMLLAVQDLRRKYHGEEQQVHLEVTSDEDLATDRCPLCRTCFALTEEWCAKICPWFLIEGRSCMTPGGPQIESYMSHPISQRLARIDRWENVIVEELASRRIVKGE